MKNHPRAVIPARRLVPAFSRKDEGMQSATGHAGDTQGLEYDNRGLDRYVLDTAERPSFHRAAYFVAPSGEAWWWGAGRAPVGQLAGDPSSFVLLAPARGGKSTVLDALRSLEPGAVQVDLRTLDLTEARQQLGAALETGGPVYLDALDEVVLHEPRMFRALEQQLTTLEARGVPWRLACRPAAWSPHLARVLRASLRGFRELCLLPLHREAVRRIVADVGADPEAFLDAIESAGLGRLAAAPKQLETAARRWEETGRLPDSSVEVMHFELDHLLPEQDPGRPPPSVSNDRQRRLAQRLAALAFFSGEQRFAVHDTEQPGVTSAAALPSTPEPDELGTPVTPADYATVLHTALFEPAPGSTVSFRHHQYTEFLAAEYLAQRGIGSPRLRTLLGVQSDGLLPGSMVGLAAWLTALDPSLTADLVAANAVQFARAGVEMPSERARAAVVDGLLGRAAQGDCDPAWEVDLSPLVHAHLVEQLDGWLAEEVQEPVHLWWVAKLAAAGACHTLVEPLLALTLACGWPDWARQAGVHALRDLAEPHQLEQLRALLPLDEEEDPDDEVLADTLGTLYPAVLSTAELFQVLRPRRNEDLVGGYMVLLGKLTDLIPDPELPTALSWLADHVNDDEEAYAELPQQLIQRAWDASATEAVLRGLATVLARVAHGLARFHLLGRRTPRVPPWTDAADARRRLAVAVAEELNSEDGWLALFDLDAITADDALWLLDSLPDLPQRAQPALTACLPHLARQPSAELADRILTLAPDHPGYDATASLRTPSPFDPDTTRGLRRHRPVEGQHANESLYPKQHRDRLLDALSEAERDPTQWWNVARWLAADDEGSPTEALCSHDLTRRSGWALLDEGERERVIHAGLEYLSSHELDPEHWRGQRTISGSVAFWRCLRDWAGVYLLTTLTRHDPQRVRDLDASTWARLAPAIVGAWNFDHDDDILRAQLLQLAPDQAWPHLVEAARQQLDAGEDGERPLPDSSLYEELIPELAQPLADRLLEGRYPQQVGPEILDELAEHAPEIAVRTCHELRARDQTEFDAAAARHLAQLDAPSVVGELATNTPSDQALLDFIPHLNTTDLDGSQLAQLAKLLVDHFPYATDPRTPSQGLVYADFQTRQVRNKVLNRLADAGEADQLEQLAADRPEPDRNILRRLLRHARTRAADHAMAPLRPHQLLSLLNQADARLVRSDDDLLEVVVEQLTALQHELISDGAFRDLWNETRPKREDDISDWIRRHLQHRLGGGTIIDREVHVSRQGGGGIGTRVDLAATTTTATQPANVARITIEAKHIHHPDLLTALTDQLAHRYLEPDGRRHGIYLTYWVAPEQRPSAWSRHGPHDQRELADKLNRQAAGLNPDFAIRPFIFDISRPSS